MTPAALKDAAEQSEHPKKARRPPPVHRVTLWAALLTLLAASWGHVARAFGALEPGGAPAFLDRVGTFSAPAAALGLDLATLALAWGAAHRAAAGDRARDMLDLWALLILTVLVSAAANLDAALTVATGGPPTLATIRGLDPWTIGRALALAAVLPVLAFGVARVIEADRRPPRPPGAPRPLTLLDRLGARLGFGPPAEALAAAAPPEARGPHGPPPPPAPIAGGPMRAYGVPWAPDGRGPDVDPEAPPLDSGGPGPFAMGPPAPRPRMGPEDGGQAPRPALGFASAPRPGGPPPPPPPPGPLDLRALAAAGRALPGLAEAAAAAAARRGLRPGSTAARAHAAALLATGALLLDSPDLSPAAAAAALGVSRPTVYARARALGIMRAPAPAGRMRWTWAA